MNRHRGIRNSVVCGAVVVLLAPWAGAQPDRAYDLRESYRVGQVLLVKDTSTMEVEGRVTFTFDGEEDVDTLAMQARRDMEVRYEILEVQDGRPIRQRALVVKGEEIMTFPGEPPQRDRCPLVGEVVLIHIAEDDEVSYTYSSGAPIPKDLTDNWSLGAAQRITEGLGPMRVGDRVTLRDEDAAKALGLEAGDTGEITVTLARVTDGDDAMAELELNATLTGHVEEGATTEVTAVGRCLWSLTRGHATLITLAGTVTYQFTNVEVDDEGAAMTGRLTGPAEFRTEITEVTE